MNSTIGALGPKAARQRQRSVPRKMASGFAS
jgi:hypothetical protein